MKIIRDDLVFDYRVLQTFPTYTLYNVYVDGGFIYRECLLKPPPPAKVNEKIIHDHESLAYGTEFRKKEKVYQYERRRYTPEQVRLARKMHKEGFKQREISEKTGIGIKSVTNIVKGFVYQDIE